MYGSVLHLHHLSIIPLLCRLPLGLLSALPIFFPLFQELLLELRRGSIEDPYGLYTMLHELDVSVEYADQVPNQNVRLRILTMWGCLGDPSAA
jgi:hypothetical protein